MNDVQVPQKEYDDLIRCKEILSRIVNAEKGNVFFICGEAGEIDNNGLPDTVFICPSMGLDWNVAYSKSK